jgi:hypothetical protein
VEEHEDEGGDDDDGGDPAEDLGDAQFGRGAGFVVGDDAAEDEAGDEAAAVGPVIDSGHEEAEDEDGDDPGDEAGAELLHVGAVAAGGDGDHQADQAEDGGAGAERGAATEECAEEKAGGAGDGVEEEKARGAVEFFDNGADVHKNHHVEADVDEAAVEITGGDEAIPLVHDEDGEREAGAEAIDGFAAHAPENGEAAALAVRDHGHEFHGEHEDVDDEEAGGDGSVAAEKFGEALTDFSHREAEIGAAVVTARGVDADERAARGADLRARVLIATAAEETAHGVFPAGEAVLPLIGKGQWVSLRVTSSAL